MECNIKNDLKVMCCEVADWNQLPEAWVRGVSSVMNVPVENNCLLLSEINWRFRGAYCLHHQGDRPDNMSTGI
jgi:hypothetical protein